MNEDDSDAFADGMLLPEATLRTRIQSDCTLLKAISETKVRTVDAVLQEWSTHDPKVAWIYRNPVDVYRSHIERWEGYRGRPEVFAKDWACRNQMVLDALGTWRHAITIVSYADLCRDPRVFKHLCTQLNINGNYRFRADQGQGSGEDTETESALIQEGTAAVLASLDAHRGCKGSPAAHWTRSGAQAVGALTEGWRRLRSG